jgi:hypothetical protein
MPATSEEATSEEATSEEATTEDRERPTTASVGGRRDRTSCGDNLFRDPDRQPDAPALLAASVRFLVAGGLMFAFTFGRGDTAGTRAVDR